MAPPENHPDHTPDEVHELHRAGAVLLVDVRTAEEREAGRIGGGDVHIDLGELAARAAELDGERPIVFYCRTGARSDMAAQAFRASGFDARNMLGGLVEWRARGLPLEPTDGRVI